MKVGVPVVPGTPGPVASYQDGDAFIKEHGFPGKVSGASIYAIGLTSSKKSSSRPRWEAAAAACASCVSRPTSRTPLNAP